MQPKSRASCATSPRSCWAWTFRAASSKSAHLSVCCPQCLLALLPHARRRCAAALTVRLMHVVRACSSSVEDARATLLLYKLAATPWEKEIASIAARLEGRRDKRAKKQNRGE